jgi:hypothetical protein
MDEQRIDWLARVLAKTGARRGVARGLVGAVALLVSSRRVREVSAQSYLGLGAPCTDDSQCAQTQMSYVSCADNGFTYDGLLNCCVYDYGNCGSDEDCCGGLVCVGGTCGAAPLAAQDGLPLGTQCYSADQCIGGGFTTDCADNGGFVPACCLIWGQACTADIDCCMPNNCVGGICR